MQVKTNRSLIVLILLSIVTFGIYALFFWHKYIQDVNTMCAGDGKNTRGLLALIFLSIITFGIYALVWEYGIQERLCDNAPRYNADPLPGGSTIILWEIFGSLLFGIGPFVALYLQINSINRLAYGYTKAFNHTISGR